MVKYEKHSYDKGKYQCPVCTYGHGKGNGKSRQSVSKHYNKAHNSLDHGSASARIEDSAPITNLQTEAEDLQTNPIIEPTEEIVIDEPEWLTVDFGDGAEQIVQSIPSPVRGLLSTLAKNHDPDKPRTRAEAKLWFQQQARMVRFFLSGVLDPLVSWYGRGLMANPEFQIKRSAEEWKLTEDITAQWLEYRGVVVPINPDVLMIGTLGALYLPPMSHIHRNRDPNRPKKSIRGIITRWRARRAVRKALKDQAFSDETSEILE
jgi:hypothetical protein